MEVGQMSQPDLTNTKFVIRCMGGDRCRHAAGTCTATQGDKSTPENWVLTEAAKRCGWDARPERLPILQADYWNSMSYRALCDMIAKHEQKPVDRKMLCAREAVSEDYFGDQRDDATDACVRAIELWEQGFGK